ncbi:MAG: lamin tail domain-containing protein [Saprospiraceae bacterium]
MIKQIFFVLLFIAISKLNAQIGFSDDFTDANFSNNPEWITSDPSSFIINSDKTLQLKAAVAGKSSISTAYESEPEMIWEMSIRLDFSPSKSNRCIIFLEKINNSQGQNDKNYAIVIGEDGNEDKIRFYALQSNSISGAPLFSAKTICLSNNQVNCRLRLKRTLQHLWSLEADYSGGLDYKKEAEFQENGSFQARTLPCEFSIICEYTETRRDKFFFDDLKAGKNEPDKSPPIPMWAKAVNARQVDIGFSEVVDSLSSSKSANYSINQGISQVDSVKYAFNKISLYLASALLPEYYYELFVGPLADISGNFSAAAILKFNTLEFEVPIDKYDIVINEILADPLPQIALPKAEFIELYNRSNKSINLSGWSLRDGGKTNYFLPERMIKAGQYLIISKRESINSFGKYGDTLTLPALFALDASGDDVFLFNEKNHIIDEFHYSLDTYRDVYKSGGGYSLEKINPETSCLGAENWIASRSGDGGTPGKANSVLSDSIIRQALQIIKVFPQDSLTLEITFDRRPQLSLVPTIELSGSLKGNLVREGDNPNQVLLTLEKPMKKNTQYSISAGKQLMDCIGNHADSGSIFFALPEPIDISDIVINEILFNPFSGSYDFLELFNRSKKVLNLKGLNIENEKSPGSSIEISSDYLLLPGSYVSISENADNIRLKYRVANNKQIIANELPPFPDDEGNIILYMADAPGRKVIDQLNYTREWHYPLLRDQSGVSLERINPDNISSDKNNWHSAASIVGFATPTAQNSQFLLTKQQETNRFSIENTRISPDNDGFEDFIMISYQMPNSINASIRVFDLSGKLQKSIILNQTLQTEGQIRWDGECDDGTRIPMGLYPIVFEYFSQDGKVGIEKKIITVANKI